MTSDQLQGHIARSDRVVGSIVGMAVGNALGAGYAFVPRTRPQDVRMRGGGLGPYAPGEWVDDTAMAIPILRVLADGGDLLSQQARDEVAAQWAQWASEAKDLAPVVAGVLTAYDPVIGAESMRRAAAVAYAADPGQEAGNASLMRTTPVTLGYLDDPDGLTHASRVYSELTHGHPQAGDACVLWNHAVRHAILNAEFDLAVGLPWIPEERQALWAHLITKAEVGPPEDFAMRSGWAPGVLQTAWSAIVHTDTEGPEHLEQALRLAVAAGGDTATVAAVAGGLLGARWGVSAVPLEWRRTVFGWPGYRDTDLLRDTYAILARAPWPASFAREAGPAPLVVHPRDAGVLLGGVRALPDVPEEVDAVVSLCMVGDEGLPVRVDPRNHVQVWLVDSDDPADNPNLQAVAQATVDLIARLRADGRTVFLHCADARSCTPFIAALYSAQIADISAEEALKEVQQVMSGADLNPVFARYVQQYG